MSTDPVQAADARQAPKFRPAHGLGLASREVVEGQCWVRWCQGNRGLGIGLGGAGGVLAAGNQLQHLWFGDAWRPGEVKFRATEEAQGAR